MSLPTTPVRSRRGDEVRRPPRPGRAVAGVEAGACCLEPGDGLGGERRADDVSGRPGAVGTGINGRQAQPHGGGDHGQPPPALVSLARPARSRPAPAGGAATARSTRMSAMADRPRIGAGSGSLTGPPTQLEQLPGPGLEIEAVDAADGGHRVGGRAARPVQAPTIAPAMAAMVSLSPPRPRRSRQPPRRRRATARTRRRRPVPTASAQPRCRARPPARRPRLPGRRRASAPGWWPQDQRATRSSVDAWPWVAARAAARRPVRAPLRSGGRQRRRRGHGNRGSAGVATPVSWATLPAAATA